LYAHFREFERVSNVNGKTGNIRKIRCFNGTYDEDAIYYRSTIVFLIYIVSQKKTSPFYICDNLVRR